MAKVLVMERVMAQDLVTAMVTAMVMVAQEMAMVRAVASVIIAKVMDMDLAAVLVTAMVMVIAHNIKLNVYGFKGFYYEKSIED